MIFTFCQHCGEKTAYLNINEATVEAAISRRTIYDWIGQGKLHLAQNPSGHKFICKRSLLRPYAKAALAGVPV
jgi:hypothetical protein